MKADRTDLHTAPGTDKHCTSPAFCPSHRQIGALKITLTLIKTKKDISNAVSPAKRNNYKIGY